MSEKPAGADPERDSVEPALPLDAAPSQPHREPIFNLPVAVIAIIAVCAITHFVRLYVLTVEQDFMVLLYGAFIPIRYSGQFDLELAAFTSPITYSLLHGSIAHLAINMTWLAAFGSPLANRLGAIRFFAFWVATALAAVALHYVLHRYDQSPLIGASGSISGMMGAAARFGFQVDRTGDRPMFSGPLLPIAVCLRSRPVVTFLAVWMVINLVTGLFGFGIGDEMSIAWEAHVGGFLMGFLGAALFIDRGTPPAHRRRRNQSGS